jgi:hypothetical protein
VRRLEDFELSFPGSRSCLGTAWVEGHSGNESGGLSQESTA